MDSAHDTPSRGWVAPFGDPRIKARSRLPGACRSVPRPSSPLGAKASTRCPSFPSTPPSGNRTAAPPRGPTGPKTRRVPPPLEGPEQQHTHSTSSFDRWAVLHGRATLEHTHAKTRRARRRKDQKKKRARRDTLASARPRAASREASRAQRTGTNSLTTTRCAKNGQHRPSPAAAGLTA